MGGVGTHCLSVASAQVSWSLWAHSVAENGHTGGPFAICQVKAVLCGPGSLMTQVFSGIFSALVDEAMKNGVVSTIIFFLLEQAALNFWSWHDANYIYLYLITQ